MFGYSLNREQERDVLKLLGVVASCDRDVTPEERQYVVSLSHDFNASAEGVFDVSKERSLAEVCKSFDDDTAKRIALIYVIRLSFIDGLYNSDEFIGVRAIADELGIVGKEPAEFEDWVRRGLEWEEEGRRLLGLPSKWIV